MPAGRYGALSGAAYVESLSYRVNVRSLRRHAKASARVLTVAEIRELRRILRKMVYVFLIAKTDHTPTATERRKRLEKIRVAAARLAASPSNKSWAKKIEEGLAATGDSSRRVLYDELAKNGHSDVDVIKLKRLLRDMSYRHMYRLGSPEAVAAEQISTDHLQRFLIKGLPLIITIAEIDVRALVPESGRWPDPPMASLIAALEPTWRSVTGRTTDVVMVKDTDAKRCRYAEWIGEIVQAAGKAPPTTGLVLDVVRSAKMEKSGNLEAQSMRG